MKNIRTLFATLTLTLILTGSALAGETQTPPCIPGETQTPPCSSHAVASTDPSETSAPPQSVDLVSLGELALELLLF